MEMQNIQETFPRIMGIVNVTHDSFSDGGHYFHHDNAIRHAQELISLGADILDVGGQSTRPGAERIAPEEEIRRVIPVIRAIRKVHAEIPISIDTTNYQVAEEALIAGATMINDVSGLQFEPRLADLAVSYQVPLCIMHMQGTPQTMQMNPHYDDVVSDVYNFLLRQIDYARSRGVRTIIADVGIGFGKTYQHNMALLRSLDVFGGLGVDMLVGVSRKSLFKEMFQGMAQYEHIVENPLERDSATMALHLCLQARASVQIIRVHNVALAYQVRTVWNALYRKSDEVNPKNYS